MYFPVEWPPCALRLYGPSAAALSRPRRADQHLSTQKRKSTGMSTQDRDCLFMMFVEILDFTKFSELLPKHLAWLTRQFEDGRFVVTGGLSEVDGSEGNHALAILRAPSLQAAQELVLDDPFLVARVCRVTFRQYTPRMHAETFGRVFSGEQSKAITLSSAVRQGGSP
jgi:uncharacterized protein YciI